MKKFRHGLLAVCLLFGVAGAASARVDVSINLSMLPELVPLPGYPVYYAPSVEANFFFYDGMYWLYEDDTWYASDWYNGPWEYVDPEAVPVFVLRIPVRYYRRPPPYFRGWRIDAPPRWGYHWGPEWEHHRTGWDHWDRRHVPARAPLPSYRHNDSRQQRDYSGERYPQHDRQPDPRDRNYRDHPHAIEPHDRDRAPTRPTEPERRDYSREQPTLNRPNDIERHRPQNERGNQPSSRPSNNRPDSSVDNREAQYQRRGPTNREPQQRPPESQNRGGGQNSERSQGPRDQGHPRPTERQDNRDRQ